MRMNLPKVIWQSWINLLFIILFCYLLNGCASSGTAIPQGGPTMAEVYADAMGESNAGSLDKIRSEVNKTQSQNASPSDLKNSSAVLTRTSQNEINNLFPQLPNPQLVMYVYPHFSGTDEAPVPGYSTVFSLYDKNYYASFGEV